MRIGDPLGSAGVLCLSLSVYDLHILSNLLDTAGCNAHHADNVMAGVVCIICVAAVCVTIEICSLTYHTL